MNDVIGLYEQYSPVLSQLDCLLVCDRSCVTGAVHFKELGDHVLELAGWPQHC